MTDPMHEFLAEGMIRYKPAAATMVSFGKAIEERLQRILSSREPDQWGGFVPSDDARARSTTYWSKYPLLNAKLSGTLGDLRVTVELHVDWYNADGDYPLYSVVLTGLGPHEAAARAFAWPDGLERLRGVAGAKLMPTPSDFDLARDFDRLLDAVASFFAACLAE